MRLSRIAYIQLYNHIKQQTWVQDSQHATVEEKIVLFLHITSHNNRFIKVKSRFQHSTETLNMYFHEVLNEKMKFSQKVLYIYHLIKISINQEGVKRY